MDPVAALLEIASLLERERASRYRAKAFRQAAQTWRALPDDIRTDPTRLRAVEGIGASTFAVIQQALEGGVPEYLVALRGKAERERSSALRAKLRGDLHSLNGLMARPRSVLWRRRHGCSDTSTWP